ncbi:MAG: TolC family protein [Endomicrobia bacterium]|nr:TolC family protein [Endomicrobiia bacterium]MCL2507374.1 TolC family protein [Endomicrobiia bacterium]
MKKLKLLAGFMVLFAVSYAYASESVLTMQEYLNMVSEKNSELKSVQSNIDAVKGKIAEIERTYSYFLSAGANYAYDASGKPYSFISVIGNLSNFTYDASLSRQFETGTQVSVGLQGSHWNYKFDFGGADYSVSDISPFVRLSQSLIKDFDGGATKASIAQARASANSVLYLLEYRKQSILLNARLAYWNLSYSQTVIDYRQASLDRTKKILEWNQRRYNMDLAERSDMLQSQAAVKMRELNLRLAYEEETRSKRVFNQFLEIPDSSAVIYNVERFDKIDMSFVNASAPNRRGTRFDVLSALEDVKSADFASQAQERNMGADLVVAGQIGANSAYGELANKTNSLSTGGPSFAVGLRYTLPLDFSLRKDINKGFESAKISSQKAAQSAAVRENTDWLLLMDNWNNAKFRLNLAREIQKIQQDRNNEDQDLLRRGRSTTFFVLQSEQDLDDANLSVLQGKLELISIYELAEAFYNNK